MKQHLSTLSILHYVYGGFICLGGFIAIGLIFLGGFLNSDFIAENSHGEPPPEFVGGLLQIVGAVLFLVIEVWGIFTILAGKWITEQKHRTATLVMAGFHCLNFPLGMGLGIFTIVTLMDEEVKQAYGVVG